MSQSGSDRPIVATLAVVPLAVLFPLEVLRLAFGLGGASAFALGLRLGWIEAGLVTVALTISLGAFLMGGVRRVQPYFSEGSRRLQRGAGILCWALVALHLSHVWKGLDRYGAEPLAQYEFLRNWLSLPMNVAFYVLGLGAMSLYLVQGVPAVLRAWGLVSMPGSQRRWEIALGVLAWLFFVFTINVLSHYAAGGALWKPWS